MTDSSIKPSVSNVLKRFGQQYLDRFGTQMTAQQKKVLRAVMACREESLGTIRYRCICCGHQQTVPRSCCNRHCPGCQWQQQQAWLRRQREMLLPCHYFLITFTLPKQLRPLAMRNPKIVYAAMLTAAAKALKTGATNDRFIGAQQIGLLGVLHTWGRDLAYHPHVHWLVPGGGVDRDGRWRSSRANLFVPEQVLEALFRKSLKQQLDQAGLLDEVPANVWSGRFVVNSKAVGSGVHALSYLAPYVSRGAVANWRVTHCDFNKSLDDALLTLQVKRTGSQKYRGMPLSVIEFIRRWLQHVLPCGLHRIRYYGFLHSSSRLSVMVLQLLIAVALGQLHYLYREEIVIATSTRMQCEVCGGAMVSLGYTPPARSTDQSRGPP